MKSSQIQFGDDTLGAKLRGFDRDYLRALASGGRAGKIVLGETESGSQSIPPTAGQRLAVGGRANLRSLNVHTDADFIVRRVPLVFAANNEFVPSMALELASRAQGASPRMEADGVTLAGERVPSTVEKTIAVAFSGGSNDIPSYSLADLRACLEKGDKNFFRRQFADKVVIVGSDVANADQILTSKRFVNPPLPQDAERCTSPAPAKVPQLRSMSGVYLQAMAVDNLIRRRDSARNADLADCCDLVRRSSGDRDIRAGVSGDGCGPRRSNSRPDLDRFGHIGVSAFFCTAVA